METDRLKVFTVKEPAALRLHLIGRRHPMRDAGHIERAVDCGKLRPGFPTCRNAALRRYCEPEKYFRTKQRPAPSPSGDADHV